MTYAEEAIGIARAAQAAGVPVVVSFTVETDGGCARAAARRGDRRPATRRPRAAPAYYMVNCAHPTHFRDGARRGGRGVERIGGIRANASKMSHAELDEAPELDDGDPGELAERLSRAAARCCRACACSAAAAAPTTATSARSATPAAAIAMPPDPAPRDAGDGHYTSSR